MGKHRKFKLTPGEAHLFDARLNEPVIEVIGAASQKNVPYLWIGGNGCVGTLSGRSLRALANAILDALDKPTRPPRGKAGGR